MKSTLLLLLFSALPLTNLVLAQCAPPPATQCAQAVPLVCTVEQYCGTTWNSMTPTGLLLCNNEEFSVWGIQIIRFIASGPVISLTVDYDQCNGVPNAPGGGLIYGMNVFLYDGCPNGNLEAVDCDFGVQPSGTLQILYNGATPGAEYFLVFTGVLGNICNYTVNGILGTDPYDPLGAPQDPFEGAVHVCKHETILYNAPPIENADLYIWDLPFGGTISTTTPELEYTWDESLAEGFYTICVSASNTCHYSENYACLDVFLSHSQTLFVDVIGCEGDIYFYEGEAYLIPGSYTHIEENPNGCDLISLLSLGAFEEIQIQAVTLTPDDGSGSGVIFVSVVGGIFPYQYFWSTEMTGPELTGLEAGIYSVTVTDAVGCTGEATFEIILQTSTLTLQAERDYQLIPNPVTQGHALLLTTGADIHLADIRCMDAAGRLIRSTGVINTQLQTIPVDTWMPGVYFIRMTTTDGRTGLEKIIVQ